MACSICGIDFEPSRPHHRMCWSCWRLERDAAPRTINAPESVPLETLRDAVTLCHPDRHPPERAELATRVTAELLRHLDLAKRRAA